MIKTHRIIIEVEDDGERLAVSVDVPGELSTLEAVGLMEIAKTQHLTSNKHEGELVVEPPPPLMPVTRSIPRSDIGSPDT